MTQQELLAAAGRLSKAAPTRAQTLELVSQERFFSTVLLMVVIPLLCFSLTLVLGETRTLWRYVPTKAPATAGCSTSATTTCRSARC